ncbi:TIGR00730 family Rossman fold protein [Pararhizobium sp. IMCC21322]|uniref:LOG family protein n=1 Tax=Pararhizobium sp. IMCC21322 TaxID=3067903 RepID=UPI002740B565|nr:TIGR00730 family Rossman fold protein [Pararhizobium sp. IMCC21322]
MGTISSICVYCGAGSGTDPAHMAAATALGRILAEEKIRLIYGGGTIGMMGAVSKAVLENGGQVTGIIPRFLLDMEASHEELERLDELILTEDMHERKRTMFDKADAFIALPGGIGTLEELVEQLTWAQLGRHKKPVLLANINNFWQPLIELISHMQEEAYIREGFEVNFLNSDDVEQIVPLLRKTARETVEADSALEAIGRL